MKKTKQTTTSGMAGEISTYVMRGNRTAEDLQKHFRLTPQAARAIIAIAVPTTTADSKGDAYAAYMKKVGSVLKGGKVFEAVSPQSVAAGALNAMSRSKDASVQHVNEGVADTHQQKIAVSTLKMSRMGAQIAGGMDHAVAVAVLKDAGWSPAKIASQLKKAGHGGTDIKKWMGESFDAATGCAVNESVDEAMAPGDQLKKLFDLTKSLSVGKGKDAPGMVKFGLEQKAATLSASLKKIPGYKELLAPTLKAAQAGQTWAQARKAMPGKTLGESVDEGLGRKVFYTGGNIGKAKYTVHSHDGKKSHGDGSPFYDIAIFKNKVKRDQKMKELLKQGYKEVSSAVHESTDEGHIEVPDRLKQKLYRMVQGKSELEFLKAVKAKYGSELAAGAKRSGWYDMLTESVDEATVTAAEALAQMKMGDRVTLSTPQGQTVSGKAVMQGPHGWAVNLGGKYGTPGVATKKNLIKWRGKAVVNEAEELSGRNKGGKGKKAASRASTRAGAKSVVEGVLSIQDRAHERELGISVDEANDDKTDDLPAKAEAGLKAKAKEMGATTVTGKGPSVNATFKDQKKAQAFFKHAKTVGKAAMRRSGDTEFTVHIDERAVVEVIATTGCTPTEARMTVEVGRDWDVQGSTGSFTYHHAVHGTFDDMSEVASIISGEVRTRLRARGLEESGVSDRARAAIKVLSEGSQDTDEGKLSQLSATARQRLKDTKSGKLKGQKSIQRTSSELTALVDRTVIASARSMGDLNKMFREAGLDPSDFKLSPAIARIEGVEEFLVDLGDGRFFVEGVGMCDSREEAEGHLLLSGDEGDDVDEAMTEKRMTARMHSRIAAGLAPKLTTGQMKPSSMQWGVGSKAYASDYEVWLVNARRGDNSKPQFSDFGISPKAAEKAEKSVRKKYPAGTSSRGRKLSFKESLEEASGKAVTSDPPVIAGLRKIVREHQHQKVTDAKGKTQDVDATTANAVVTVYDALGAGNRKKFADLPLTRMASTAFKMLEAEEGLREGSTSLSVTIKDIFDNGEHNHPRYTVNIESNNRDSYTFGMFEPGTEPDSQQGNPKTPNFTNFIKGAARRGKAQTKISMGKLPKELRGQLESLLQDPSAAGALEVGEGVDEFTSAAIPAIGTMHPWVSPYGSEMELVDRESESDLEDDEDEPEGTFIDERGNIERLPDTEDGIEEGASLHDALIGLFAANEGRAYKASNIAKLQSVSLAEAMKVLTTLVREGTLQFKRGEGYSLRGGQGLRLPGATKGSGRSARITDQRTHTYESETVKAVRVREKKSVVSEWVCPHCDEVIGEKALFYGGMSEEGKPLSHDEADAPQYYHSVCGNPIELPEGVEERDASSKMDEAFTELNETRTGSVLVTFGNEEKRDEATRAVRNHKSSFACTTANCSEKQLRVFWPEAVDTDSDAMVEKISSACEGGLFNQLGLKYVSIANAVVESLDETTTSGGVGGFARSAIGNYPENKGREGGVRDDSKKKKGRRSVFDNGAIGRVLEQMRESMPGKSDEELLAMLDVSDEGVDERTYKIVEVFSRNKDNTAPWVVADPYGKEWEYKSKDEAMGAAQALADVELWDVNLIGNGVASESEDLDEGEQDFRKAFRTWLYSKKSARSKESPDARKFGISGATAMKVKASEVSKWRKKRDAACKKAMKDVTENVDESVASNKRPVKLGPLEKEVMRVARKLRTQKFTAAEVQTTSPALNRLSTAEIGGAIDQLIRKGMLAGANDYFSILGEDEAAEADADEQKDDSGHSVQDDEFAEVKEPEETVVRETLQFPESALEKYVLAAQAAGINEDDPCFVFDQGIFTVEVPVEIAPRLRELVGV